MRTETVKHTPGPWEVRHPHKSKSAQDANSYGDPGDCAIFVRGHGGPLAECFERFVSRDETRPEECEANARLIAASPELLEACQAVVDSMGIRKDFAPVGTLDYAAKLLNAIAKATGVE